VNFTGSNPDAPEAPEAPAPVPPSPGDGCDSAKLSSASLSSISIDGFVWESSGSTFTVMYASRELLVEESRGSWRWSPPIEEDKGEEDKGEEGKGGG